MNISCLNIRQQYAKIDLSIQNAQFDISAKLGEMDINTPSAVMDISTDKGGLEIDSSPCRYAVGLKSSDDFIRDAAQDGMQALHEFTARIVDNGKQYTDTTNDAATSIANNAVANSKVSQPPLRLVLKYLDRPYCNYTPDKVNISYQPSKANIQIAPARFENNTQAGSVNTSLSQQPNVRMWLTEGKFDTYA